MAWHIITRHHVAHIHPTITNGTTDSNYPYTNVRTLNPHVVARMTDAGSNLTVDFDRTALSGKGVVNCLMIFNSSMDSGNVEAYSGTDGATYPTTLVSATAAASNMFFTFADNTDRYLRFEWTGASTADFGVISFGGSRQVATSGPQIATESHVTLKSGTGDPQEGLAKIIRSFREVTRANSESILAEARDFYIRGSGSNLIDGFGPAAGASYIGVADDSDNTVYYGKGSVRLKPWGANYSEVFVDMVQEKETVLG